MTINRLRELVNEEQLRTPRTVAELMIWMDAVENAIDDDETRHLFRLTKGPNDERIDPCIKVYRDEVFLARVFSESVFNTQDAKIWFPMDGGPADAIVKGWPAEGILTPLQITNAIDGQDDRLRMEMLTAEGSAPGLGPIRRNKATGAIEAVSSAEERSNIVTRQCDLVRSAIRKKVVKSYPLNTWLIVGFDDAIGFRSPWEPQWDCYLPVLRAAVIEMEGSGFRRAYLVGSLTHRYCARIL